MNFMPRLMAKTKLSALIYQLPKIADDLGVDLKIEELGFDALLGALKTGKIDLVISGMAATDERKRKSTFLTLIWKSNKK